MGYSINLCCRDYGLSQMAQVTCLQMHGLSQMAQIDYIMCLAWLSLA